MQVLQVISLLLDYPQSGVAEARDDLQEIIQASPLTDANKAQLSAFLQRRTTGDLMDWQSEYDGLFERGRSLSLLLFEHVHGESKDRGQAMVDLMNQYHEAGLDIGIRELPDYIPLYLEFLSTQGDENARLGLAEVGHILAVLACRLENRKSDYAALAYALLDLSGVEVDLNDLREQVVKEERDDTPKALDKVWEEEVVTFTGSDSTEGCPTAQSRPSELQRRDQFIPLNTDDLSKPAKPVGI